MDDAKLLVSMSTLLMSIVSCKENAFVFVGEREASERPLTRPNESHYG